MNADLREQVARTLADIEGADWSMPPVTDETWPALRESYLRKADRILATPALAAVLELVKS